MSLIFIIVIFKNKNNKASAIYMRRYGHFANGMNTYCEFVTNIAKIAAATIYLIAYRPNLLAVFLFRLAPCECDGSSDVPHEVLVRRLVEASSVARIGYIDVLFLSLGDDGRGVWVLVARPYS